MSMCTDDLSCGILRYLQMAFFPLCLAVLLYNYESHGIGERCKFVNDLLLTVFDFINCLKCYLSIKSDPQVFFVAFRLLCI